MSGQIETQVPITPRAFLDIAGVMFIALDKVGNVTLINQKGCDILEYSKKEIVGKNWFDHFVPQAVVQNTKSVFTQLMNGKMKPVEYYENPVLSKSGQEKMVAWHNTILKDKNGTICGTLSSGEDVTERMKLEEALEKERQDLKLIIDTSPIIIFYKDQKGKVVRVNKAFAKALQMSEREFVGKTVFDLYSPTIAQKMADDDREVFETGRPKMNIIEQYESASGIRWVRTDKIPILDDKGVSIGLIGFAQDITERKQAEMALKESEKRYRSTLENMLEGCQIIGHDWQYVYVNKMVCRHGRKTKKELLGHTMMEVYPGIENTEMFSFLERCMEKRIPHRMENEFVYSDGKKRWFELSMQPVPEGVFTLSLDITERKKAENKILHLNAVLHAIRNVGQLIAQEKNPKRLIQSICEILVETRRYQSTWIMLLDDSGEIVMSAEAGIGNIFPSMVKQFKGGELPFCARRALKRSSVMVINKPGIECCDCSLCRIHPENKIITVRLEYNHKVYGLINVSMSPELIIDREEKNLFAEVANDIAFALHDMEVEEKRRHAEDALRESEENFRLMVSEVKDYAIVMLDTKGFVSSWNEGAQNINGYRSNEIMGKHFSCFFTKKEVKSGKPKKILKMAAEEGRFEEEVWQVRKDGTCFIAHVVITPIRDENGYLKGYSKVTRDITEYKKAEETLKRSEERLRTFIERAPVSVFVHDLDGRILLVNNLASEYTGYSKAELSNMNVSDIDHEIISMDHRKRYWEKLDIHEHIKIEGIHERKDKTTYPAEIQLVKIIFREQPMILAFASDITERKKAEEAIQEAEKKLRLISIHMSDYIMLLDLDFKIQYINKVGQGLTQEQLLGTQPFLFVDKKEQMKIQRMFRLVKRTRKTVSFETQYKQSDGHIVYFESIASPILFDQKVTGIVVSSRDMTGRKIAEDQIKKDLKEKEVLLREIHHRVKNNLQIIKSLLNLQSYQVKSETVIKAFNECVNRIQSMAMVHEQLYYSKDFTNIPFNAYIEKISRELIKSFQLDTVITIDLKVKDVFLSIDKAIPLGLILNELLTNALKYAFKGRKKGRITISLILREDRSYELVFQDNGVGMPENVDFKKTESLGLYLVKILIEQIDGAVTVKKQNGTIYQIVFPIDYPVVND
ncbi:PAS domain S-box protein [bacterium]|nr:PAS domain S-box protein [bacterium]RQV95052.1 MAG: PAS domain S-box protein [bacterium]